MKFKTNRKDVLIILPAYNEKKNIGPLMDELLEPEISEIADVLVMNDSSKDGTNWIVKDKGIEVVSNIFNLGYGSSLQLGYKYAVLRGYKYVIQMDADRQHDPFNIKNIYETLTTNDENGEYPDIVLEPSLRFPSILAEFVSMIAIASVESVSTKSSWKSQSSSTFKIFAYFFAWKNVPEKNPITVITIPATAASTRT